MTLLERCKNLLADGGALSQQTIAYKTESGFGSLYTLINAGELIQVGRTTPAPSAYCRPPRALKGTQVLCLREHAAKHGVTKLPPLLPVYNGKAVRGGEEALGAFRVEERARRRAKGAR